jgi:hypothetical protein
MARALRPMAVHTGEPGRVVAERHLRGAWKRGHPAMVEVTPDGWSEHEASCPCAHFVAPQRVRDLAYLAGATPLARRAGLDPLLPLLRC